MKKTILIIFLLTISSAVAVELSSIDFDKDNEINLDDLLLQMSDFGKSSDFNEEHDVNQDGKISMLDLVLVAKNIGRNYEKEFSCGSLARLWGEWCVYTYDDDIPDKIIHGTDNVYHPAVWHEDGKAHMLVGGWVNKEEQSYHDQIFHYVSDDVQYGITGFSLAQNTPYIDNDWDFPHASHTVQPSIFAGQYPNDIDCCKTIFYSWDIVADFPEKNVTINNAYISAEGKLTHGQINPSLSFNDTVSQCENAKTQGVSNGHVFLDPVSEKFYMYYNSWLEPGQTACEAALLSVAKADWTNLEFTPVNYDLLGNGAFGGSPFMIYGPDEKYYLFYDEWITNTEVEIRVRTSDSPEGPFPESTEIKVLEVPTTNPGDIVGVSTPFVLCNEQLNRWQMYFSSPTSEGNDMQIYTAFSPLGITCDDPPKFS